MNSKITRRQFMKNSAIATTGIVLNCSLSNQFDIIIKNGFVYDGTGAPGVQNEIGIKNGKIVAIGKLGNVTADKVIDASDMVVSPGFIDIHTHTDTQLLVSPLAESKIYQGVTTEIGGNCGDSPFPFNEQDAMEFDKNLFENYGVHAKWNDIDGFLTALEKKKISINFATFNGHGDLRACVVGKNDVAPTVDQLNMMKKMLEEAMEKGSLGLSTGLEYAPSSYAKTDELIELCRVVSKMKGVYATHMRNEDDTVQEAIDEALRISRDANVSLQISHLKACNRANWHKVDNMLQTILKAFESGIPVKADRYPYVAYGTSLSAFLPLWSRQGNIDEIIARMNDVSLIPKIKEHVESRGERIGGWNRVLISSCFTEENKKWEGKTILECAEETGKEPFDFIRQLLIEERNRVGMVGFAMEESNLKKVLSSPLVMIGSDGSAISPNGKLGEGKPHPRYYGTFPRVLGKYCREEKYLNLATALKKMTSMPARKLGLKQRGELKSMYHADITIFNPATVIDKATFAEPHQFPVGIEYVIVNGKLTIEKGKHTGEVSGKVLRHQAV